MTASLPPAAPLLEVRDLRKHFPAGRWAPFGRRRHVRAVDGVSFSIPRGATLGLVGESACGKTTTGWMIARLLDPTAGSIAFDGRDITALRGEALRRFRPNIQVVFQDPYTSLNPRLSAGDIVAEPLRINGRGTPAEIERRARALLEAVGIPADDAGRRAHAFSGGQRQRIAIARALALEPQLIICDEPVSALDMSVQAKILNLLRDLQRQLGVSFLFISHDLSVVRIVSDIVAVMYLGRIVESGPADAIFSDPRHPYTQALMAAVPDPYARTRVAALAGEVPSNITPPAGCRFHPRCPAKMPRCETAVPALHEIAPGRRAACFLHHDVTERSDDADAESAA
jgi:oligopeptide/dipeptide ABC transporter ATP-binding protein